MEIDFSWLPASEGRPAAAVKISGTEYDVPLSSELDLIASLKGFHGALRTWPKRPLAARWELFEKIRADLKDDKERVGRWMAAERGERLGQRELKEFYAALESWSLEDFQQEPSPEVKLGSVGLVAVLLDERHPWVSWLSYALWALIWGNAVAVRFLPENAGAASYLQSKLESWGVRPGTMQFFIGGHQGFEDMICAHPAVHAVVVECAAWERDSYKKRLSPTWKRSAILSESRPVTLLLQESTPEIAQKVVEKSLAAGFGWERLGRFFTLDKYFDSWERAITEALEAWSGVPLSHQRGERTLQWEQQKSLILKEQGVQSLKDQALYALDFSNCAPIHQEVLYGPFLSLTRSKYVHEATKFAATTPLKGHACLWGPEEKLQTWAAQLPFENVWLNCWPQWTLSNLLSSQASHENYFVGAGSIGGLFTSSQRQHFS